MRPAAVISNTDAEAEAVPPASGVYRIAGLLVLAGICLVVSRFTPVSSDTYQGLPAAVQGSLLRLTGGLLLGSAIGMAIGLSMGKSRFLDTLLGPIVHALRQIPLFGWVPLIGRAFGLGENARLCFISLAVAYVMVVAAQQATQAVAPRDAELARALCLPRRLYLLHIAWPSALPPLFGGIRLALAAAWGATVGAEVLMPGGPGLGAYIWAAREIGRVDLLLTGTLLIAALGVASNAALRRIEVRTLAWQRGSREARQR